ncbi:mediator of RNA polymerase II transcription subunit 4 [Mercurialis annua]|uniref:mediator of RNA polymerase II transcription subunit 4 n=1 Tax=Mercurialis annua TaxID=3986 RepID=UPI00215DED7D|nr:mediator of RNA polymerase II transcription subunit 4 [Mercurialis annua]
MLQHQIVHSPARLGLTNPNSPTPPKFPTTSSSSSQPPPQQQQQHASSSSTSSALLPLLPPLRRAQTLLLQMASLASTIFEVSPNRALWLSAFRGSLPTFLSSHTQSIPPLEYTPTSTKEALTLFTSLQTQLFEAVAELQEILDLQDSRQRLAREIKSKDSALLNFANKLKEAERLLDILVDDYSDYRKSKRAKSKDVNLDDDEEEDDFENDNLYDVSSSTTIASQLNLSDILSYAHRISYTTFAPPEFGAGNAPLRGAFPPAPQDEQMRASQLYAFADLDVGLPKIETKEKFIEPIIEPPPPPHPAEANSLANLSGLLPPNITVPSGWKPGMPIVLPMDLPPPPPGWKPGDPLPLPPLDSLPLPRMAEQHLQPVTGPQGLPKPPETIQVRHVQIDILDQDDDSSDYSSDEGSSDDQD